MSGATAVTGLARAAAILGLCTIATDARARDTFRIEYFDVRGATAAQLRADLSRVGPVGETGLRGDGYTEYRIAWRFSMRSGNDECRAHDVQVDLDVRMLLPRWTPPPGVNAGLLRNWERFSEVLREHEDGHHRIAVAAAKEVRRKLGGRVKAGDCRTVEARMNETANDVLQEYRRKQAEFDRKTDYGRVHTAGIL